jgi:hypothetical protein
MTLSMVETRSIVTASSKSPQRKSSVQILGRRVALALVVLFVGQASTCGKSAGSDAAGRAAIALQDLLNSTTGALDKALGELNREGANITSVLQNAVHEVTDKTLEGVRVQLKDTLDRVVASSGAQLRCSSEFLLDRTRTALSALRVQVLGFKNVAQFKDTKPPPRMPHICQIAPVPLEKEFIRNGSRPFVDIGGYDFDVRPSLSVLLESSGGSMQDVSSSLAKVTPFQLTINLGANGIGPAVSTASSSALLLRWKGEEVGKISLIEPATKVCEVKDVTVAPQPHSFAPPHGGGDANWGRTGENGPLVRLDVITRPEGSNTVRAGIYADLREDGGDDTTAAGYEHVTLFMAGPHETIYGLNTLPYVGPQWAFYFLKYTHTLGSGIDAEQPRLVGSDYIRTVTLRGLSGANAAQGNTRFDIEWMPFTIKVVGPAPGETDCISPSDVLQGIQGNFLSDGAKQKFLRDETVTDLVRNAPQVKLPRSPINP